MLNGSTFAPWFVGGMIVWVCIAMFQARRLVDGVTGARELAGEQRAYIHGLVEPLCISRGLSAPALMVIDDPAPNAFASGFDKENAAITVTSRLLEVLDEDELESVLAHELTHIRNSDITLMFTATVIGGWIEFWGDALVTFLRAHTKQDVNHSAQPTPFVPPRNGLVGIVVAILGLIIVILAAFISRYSRLAISRRREFLADAGAVELTKNPDALIRALLKLEANSRLERMPSAIQSMCFCNPLEGILALFSTHPPVAKRVEALVQYAGGRRPHAVLPGSAPTPAGPWSNTLKKQA
jgi:heat shock protein HtpX